MGLFTRLFRERAGEHLDVAVDRDVVRRGDDVRVTLTIADAERAGDEIEVGIVCTERYADRQTSSSGSSGTTTRRVMVDATEYERWESAQPGVPLQHFTFTIPADGPFSYEGEHLSLRWRVSAREPVRFRPDPSANVDLAVRP